MADKYLPQASPAKWANWPWRWGVEPCHCATRLTGCAPALRELQKRLVRPGASLGGARPKSLITLDDEAWLVKFSEGEDIDTPLIEHATMELARACGIEVATTRALPIGSGHAVAIKRFDRNGPMRVHVVSAHVALRAAGEAPGYPQLAQLLRRVAPAEDIRSQQAQLFRRMVFNILMDNTDDHGKNHALLRQSDGHYRLSPAFNVVPSAQGLGYQAMVIGDLATESTLVNALSHARQFGLKPDAAHAVLGEVASGVVGWKVAFAAKGVSNSDIELLAQFIDGDRLRVQRDAFLRV